MKIERFEDLEIWKEARELCRFVFQITSKELFLKGFRFGNQKRALSGSIMDNIAEGFNRGGNKEFIQFLFIAKGSSAETKSQVYRAFNMKYLSEEMKNELLGKTELISKRIGSLILHLKGL